MEVVEGYKEGYESDVLEPETPDVSTTEDDKKTVGMSDEEDNVKENANDSDEDFNIDNYVSYNTTFLELTAESSSIRYIHQIFGFYYIFTR